MTTDAFTTLTPRLARKKKSPKKRKLSKRKLRIVNAKRRRTINTKKALAYQAAHPPKPLGCQHPRARARGMCGRDAIGEVVGEQFVPQLFTIPADYVPQLRY